MASAARLQELVPDAVLVGGSAAPFHARHRLSADHDHVVTDLRHRFDLVMDALDALDADHGGDLADEGLPRRSGPVSSAGSERAAGVRAAIDDYGTDPGQSGEPVRSQLVRHLGNRRPADPATIGRLADYKGLAPQWQDWSAVVRQLRNVSAHLVELPVEPEQ